MAAVTNNDMWDKTSERLYETGVDHGVLYLYDSDTPQTVDGKTYNYCHGVAWNGLTAVNHSPEGAEANDTYADNIKYLTLRSAETFGFTIEALYSPDEFDACDGTAEIATGVTVGQQARVTFGFCHRSLVGNDVKGQDYGYKLHLIYGCTAAPSEHNYETVNDSPEPASLSWEIDTVPVPVGTLGSKTFKPTAKITIDSTKLDATGLTKLANLEKLLYGTIDTTGETPVIVPGVLPLPSEVYDIMKAG